ncbi:hypothetical protein [Nocardioides sp. GXQ0305]|uniref:hypothetical protein n=1 Tax=Nocardioides sp. GXQ0305 TaxID=3423912 RepID=UPI003D7DE1F7
MRPPTRGSATVAVLAWGSCALFVLMWLGTAILYVRGSGALDELLTVLALGYALTGAMVAVREPRNAVGWLLLVIALSFALQGLVDAYVAEPGRPFAVAAAWLSSCTWYVWLYVAAVVLPMLFPDGRLISPRWRFALWIGYAALACALVSEAFRPGAIDVDSPQAIPNPLGIPGAERALSALSLASDVLVTVGFLLGAAALVVRLRRARGRERQQVAWFAYVGALVVCSLLLAMFDVFVEQVGAPGAPDWVRVVGAIGWFGTLLFVVLGIPVAVGIAILRHRLYDIELVVKRTLVYGSLTVTLAAVYLVSVLSLRLLLAPVAGTSDLAVAASTLAVAALFRPVRGRIQQVVDRRFDRSRYDAALTVGSFAGRLRHEVDLDSVSTDLVGVVRDAVQPTHVSLWLRGTP